MSLQHNFDPVLVPWSRFLSLVVSCLQFLSDFSNPPELVLMGVGDIVSENEECLLFGVTDLSPLWSPPPRKRK